MEKFIQKKKNLNEEEINELLYYYEQGINIGKEEIRLKVINNMINSKFDIDVISKILNINKKNIKKYINHNHA